MTSPLSGPGASLKNSPALTDTFHATLTYDPQTLAILSANEDACAFFACPSDVLMTQVITDLRWHDALEWTEDTFQRETPDIPTWFRSRSSCRVVMRLRRHHDSRSDALVSVCLERQPLELRDHTLMLVSLRLATESISSGPDNAIEFPLTRNAQDHVQSVIGRLARCLIWYADVSEQANGKLHWDIHVFSEEAASKFLPIQREPGQHYAAALYYSRLPEDSARMTHNGPAYVRANQNYSQEYRVRTRDGEIRWLKEDVNVEPVASGRWYAVGVCTDITERKQAEEAQDYITRSARCLIWQAQVRQRTDNTLAWDVTALSEEAAQQFLPLDVPPGTSYWLALSLNRLEADRERTDRHGLESVQANRDYSQEYRELNKYGEVRWLHEDVHVEPVGPGLWHLVGVCTDVTELKRAQDVRQHVTRSARCLIWHGEVVGDPEKPADLDWQLRSLSDDIAEDFLPLDVPEGSNYLVAMTENRLEEDSQRIFTPSLTALLANRNYSQEFRVRDKYGAIWWLREDVSVERVNPGKWRLVGVCTDVTARRQAEEAQMRSQKLEALGTLAGGIAHDFNNILCAILGNTQLAAYELPPDHPVQETLREITKAGSRSADLIRQILAFSRPQEQNRKALLLQPIVEEALRLVRATLPATIEIRTVFAPDVPPVIADSTQIHQVLVNLTTNAAHAIGAQDVSRVQGGYIEIRLETLDVTGEWIGDQTATGFDLRAGRYVRLSVSDNGCGMDSATIGRIFDPFFTTKAVGEGTGLGLSVVHGIMKSHGGSVTAYSQPNAGSIFRLYFPAVLEAVENPTITSESVPRAGDKHILYVDDEEAIVLFAHRVLQRRGYTVSVCTNSKESLTLFQKRPDNFDFVVTDLSMPGMSGFDLARQLLEIRPDIRIVMTSGYIRPEDEAEARRLGIQAVLLKPFNLTDLVQALN